MQNSSIDSSEQFAGALVKGAAAALLCALALSLFAHTIIDSDIWWHLRTGQYILETRSIPEVDMYSYTAGGNRWVDLHWLFQLIVYATRAALGSYALSLLFVATFSTTFLILWKACGREKNQAAALVLFWLALMASSARFLARPEAFSYLMIAFFMLALRGFESRGGWWICALIPLQVVWTNLQGLFILGPFLIAAFAADPVFRALASRVRGRELDPLEKKSAVMLVGVAIGSLLACLLNPYGLEGALFPFTLMTRASSMQNMFAESIAELQPPFSGYNLTTPLKYFGVYLVICACVTAADFRAVRLSDLIVFAGAGYLSLSARRSVPIFVLATLPVAVEHAGRLLGRTGEGRVKLMRRLAFTASGVLCVVILVQIGEVVSDNYYLKDKRSERFGLGFTRQAFPHGAFVFLKENEVSGPFFNNLDLGGMFIWEMYPSEKVFMDPRLEVNSAEIFSEYRRAMSEPAAFNALSEKYGFNAAVLWHTSQDALYLVPVLSSSPEWALVYLDPLAAVFLRRDSQNASVIEASEIDIARYEVPLLAPHDTLNRGNPALLRGLASALKYRRPGDLEAHNRFNLGLVFMVTGHERRAIEQLKAGLELMPSSPEGHYNLGLAYDRLGEKETALLHYERCLELDARHALAHVNLGRIQDESGRKDKAGKHYRRAIRYGGEMPIPLYNLGAIYYEKGDRDKARTYWRRALDADPSFTPAREALKRLE